MKTTVKKPVVKAKAPVKTSVKAPVKAPVAAPIKAKKAAPAKAKAAPKAEKKGLDIAEIKTKAKALGVVHDKLNKSELILAIQVAELNTPCFGTGSADCPHTICCWRIDCIG
jgi:hypothetical protein